MRNLYVFKNKETKLYYHSNGDVDNIDHAEHFSVTKYAHFFNDRLKSNLYKEICLKDEKIKNLRKIKLINIENLIEM